MEVEKYYPFHPTKKRVGLTTFSNLYDRLTYVCYYKYTPYECRCEKFSKSIVEQSIWKGYWYEI